MAAVRRRTFSLHNYRRQMYRCHLRDNLKCESMWRFKLWCTHVGHKKRNKQHYQQMIVTFYDHLIHDIIKHKSLHLDCNKFA